jgi:hypothetical protein
MIIIMASKASKWEDLVFVTRNYVQGIINHVNSANLTALLTFTVDTKG